MLDTLFRGLFDTAATEVISPVHFLLCIGVSLVIGMFLVFVYCYQTKYTQSFVLTLAILPAAVCMVILMVNGNLGTGIAVAGAFSLVRFRSVPGSAKEIAAIFIAMTAGLVTGMGYLAYAVLFVLILGGVTFLDTKFGFGKDKHAEHTKILHITIPENLDYTGIFDDLFQKYTISSELSSVKTTNMGSLFKLSYQIEFREKGREKEFLDELRCRNGNLEISLLREESTGMEL